MNKGCQRVQGETANVLCGEPIAGSVTLGSPYGPLEFNLCELHLLEVRDETTKRVEPP